jgi:hypothetical protein
MLSKNEMKKFAEQFFLGKIKLKKDPTIYGKTDSYHFAKDGLFIFFENDSILLRIPDVSFFTDNTEEITSKTKNYINAINTIIKIENNVRGNDLARKLDGDVYTEMCFKVRNKKITLDLFTLKSYFAIKQEKTNFGIIFFDIPYYCNQSASISVNLNNLEMPYNRPSNDLSVKTTPNKKISGDFDMFESSIVNEILDFNYLLDDVFHDQLNTLEMALL